MTIVTIERLCLASLEMTLPTGDQKKEAVEAQPAQWIRLAITSSKLPNLQKVCPALCMKLQKEGLTPQNLQVHSVIESRRTSQICNYQSRSN
jgi:hypothetical protein